MGENAQIIPQSKVYQKYLENTENKAELIDRFTQYIQQDHVRTKLTGNVIFNSRNLTYIINSCELVTLFTSNHEEADRKTVYYCSSFKKTCTVKVKDNNLILMIYVYAVQQPEYHCCMQTDNQTTNRQPEYEILLLV